LASVKRFTTLTDSLVVNFSRYDIYGNLAEQYVANNIKEAYLWGYNGAYLVAKVTGSDYNTIAALVNNSVLQIPTSDAALRSELNNIRTALAGTHAQVTTYTYLKGVGLSSETDAAGRTIYYEYDSYGRLSRVRDQDNRILKKLDYNMAGPE
jgi:YD repeat-containing protein